MIHRSGCQNTAGYCVHAENAVTGIGDQIAAHQNWTAYRIGVNTAAQLICPIQCSVFCRRGNPEIRHRIICIGSTEIRPGRPDPRIYGAVYGSLRQFPGNRNRTAGSGFRHRIAGLSILNHQFVPFIAGHFQCAGFSHIAVLGYCVYISVTFAKLISTAFTGPQPFTGHHFIDIQKCVAGINRKSCLYRGRFQNIQGVNPGSPGSLGVFYSNGNHLRVHGAIQRDGSQSAFRHIHSVHQNFIANGFLAKAEILRIADEIQIQSLRRHGDGYIICPDIWKEAGCSIFLNQSHRHTVTFGSGIPERQFPLEFHQIVLIVSNAVAFLG